MTNIDEHPLTALTNQIRTLLQEDSVDFTDASSDDAFAQVSYLTVSVMYINTLSILKYGGKRGPVRQQGLVEQVVGAAFQTYAGYDPHPGPFDKAAVLMRGITQGHPFADGNKRTGFFAAMYYLEHVNLPIPPLLPIDEILDFCLRVSAGDLRDVREIASELQRLWERA